MCPRPAAPDAHAQLHFLAPNYFTIGFDALVLDVEHKAGGEGVFTRDRYPYARKRIFRYDAGPTWGSFAENDQAILCASRALRTPMVCYWGHAIPWFAFIVRRRGRDRCAA